MGLDADALKKDRDYWKEKAQRYEQLIINLRARASEVPVIRCKDCRFFHPRLEDNECAAWALSSPLEDDFCSCAERKVKA